MKINLLSNKLYKISNLFELTDIESIYDYLITQIPNDHKILSLKEELFIHQNYLSLIII